MSDKSKDLTAAAEVGKVKRWGFAGAIDDKIDATIERCAILVETYQGQDAYPMEVGRMAMAAAIRALKDKPAIDHNLVYPGKDPDFVFPEE